MKKYFISAVMSLVALVMLGGCATQEERAARAAAQAARVKTALAKRDFKIMATRWL